MTETSSSPPDLKDNTTQVNNVSTHLANEENYKKNPDNYNQPEYKDLNKSTWHWLQFSIVCVLKFLIFSINYPELLKGYPPKIRKFLLFLKLPIQKLAIFVTSSLMIERLQDRHLFVFRCNLWLQ